MAPPRPPTFKKTLRLQSTSMMSSLQVIADRMSEVSIDQSTLNANSLPSIDANKAGITALPNELLMPIARYLSFDKAEAQLDSVSLQEYIQCQKDLRNLCLVSKQMEPVGRQYLYRAIIVKNSDVLVYLARTLDMSPGLGNLVKQMVFEVPFDLKHERYRKPYVGVLGSRPNYAKICQMAVEAFDPAKFEEIKVRNRTEYGMEIRSTFREWGWSMECHILRQLHRDILLRLSNLELLCFAMLDGSLAPFSLRAKARVLRTIGSIDGQGPASQPVSGLHPKLKELQLLGHNGDGDVMGSWACMKAFLQIPSLRVLKCVRDDGNVHQLVPDEEFAIPLPPVTWESKNITCIDFQRSRCTPATIFYLCARFTSLEYLSISVERGAYVRDYLNKYFDGFGTRNFVSTSLGKLKYLKELRLDLHYHEDVKPLLGEHGVLEFGGLDKLTSVRLPLHSLVEAQPGNELRITDLAVALPSSVEHLTVWADADSVRSWPGVPAPNPPAPGPPPAPAVAYRPSQSALEFMESIYSLLGSHFKHLKEVTYCYGGQAPDMVCLCIADMLCRRCEALQLLDLQATEDSATRMGVLASDSEARGVCLRTLEEPFEE